MLSTFVQQLNQEVIGVKTCEAPIEAIRKNARDPQIACYGMKVWGAFSKAQKIFDDYVTVASQRLAVTSERLAPQGFNVLFEFRPKV